MSKFDTSPLLSKIKLLTRESPAQAQALIDGSWLTFSLDDLKEFQPQHTMPSGDFVSIRLESVVLYPHVYLNTADDPFPNFSFCFSYIDENDELAELVESNTCDKCGARDNLYFKQVYLAHCFRINGVNCLQLNEDHALSTVDEIPSVEDLYAAASYVVTENTDLFGMYELLPNFHMPMDCSNFFNTSTE